MYDSLICRHVEGYEHQPGHCTMEFDGLRSCQGLYNFISTTHIHLMDEDLNQTKKHISAYTHNARSRREPLPNTKSFTLARGKTT